MKDFLKTLFLIFGTCAAFFIGLYIGEERVKTKIADFQEDLEERR